MKKLMVLAVCLVMAVASAFAGGRNDGGRTTGAPTTGGEGWFAGRNFSRHLDIEFASPGPGIDEGKDYNNGDEWVKKWTREFNITFNITPFTWENWGERLRIWINSGDAPEMFVYDYNHGEARNYAEQGLVKRLPDGWKAKYPNLAKAANDSPLGAMAEESFGGTYYLFRPIYSNNRPTNKLSPHFSAYLRKDWARAAGVTLKPAMKISEIVDYARKVKAANPGRVANFSPIVVRTGNFGYFFHYNNGFAGINGPVYYRGDDGSYRWAGADASTLDTLKLLANAYREGLIDREFYTIQDPDDLGAFYTTGRSAAILADGMAWKMTEMEQHFKADLGLNFDEVVEIVTVLGEDGYYHAAPLTNYWGAVAFSPNISDEKLDRLLQMLDYSCTEEGQLEIRCGIKGVDWELNGTEIVSHLNPGESLWDKYALLPVYVNMLILSDDFQFRDPNYKQVFRNKTREMYILRAQSSTEKSFPSEPDWNVVLHSSRALNLASMVMADEYAALVIKSGDIEAAWRTWVNEKMPLIQPVLDELNAKR
ncbi:MAG: extracellular solute-binding protein [Treponema sp.]|jgi:putative aldouronate transport system substrate-binding protein|nr:extracellular solute-binding protein [Treponema sp.]